MSTELLNLYVHAKRVEADGVVSLDLRAPGGAGLPPFTAGAHIDIHVPQPDPGGRPLIRQYSLCNDPAERHRYVIGVGRAPQSAGGSLYLHDVLPEGATVQVGAPRNLFALDETAGRTVLIAGGIGITPLLAMARRLSALGRDWTLYYCVREPRRAAFLAEALALPGRVVPIFDGVPGVAPIDLKAIAAAAGPDTHLYCCGPTSLMRAFEQALAARRPQTVHVEWFSPPEPGARPQAADGAFEVRLARSGRTFTIPPGKTILDVLLDAGVDAPYGCCGGVCGACEVGVVEGSPVHLDSIFMGQEAEVSDRMMICVSRCKGDSITLDL
ncbi:PDR/VanB family oxidoreductase [Pigmentiphaga soli]|uniref:PDR/VanB family oxidoreductase n=1 Tax=Pigmentiphaga soli TaxID=1007095 RepID=A0ABP8HAM2_9BURK